MLPRDRKPAYYDLYGQSDLRNSDIKIQCLDELARLFLTSQPLEGTPLMQVRPRAEYATHLALIVDICEKLGILWRTAVETRGLESRRVIMDSCHFQYIEIPRAKYYLYTCIYNTKAITDSVSVLFNTIFDLRYELKKVDLIRNRKFRRDVKKHSDALDIFWATHAQWFKDLGDLRNALIHRESVPVFIRDSANNAVYDLISVRTEQRNGKMNTDFDLLLATEGKMPQRSFKFRGKELAAPMGFNYAFPRMRISYTQIWVEQMKLKFADFQRVIDFEDVAFLRSKELSELAFKETARLLAEKMS